mmetsp:Transcript_627/g.1822  ORF Transcript_627/g.1822 Transcript_627/m.1822 type:complete len:133 (+) Transcript_627:547-945(+)
MLSQPDPQQPDFLIPKQENDAEPEEIRILHLSVQDPYDPLCPNDLLQYWEKRALEKERHNLERQRQQALEQQEVLRRQLKREREELARGGDGAHTNLASARPRILGRGRGVSNLPAWLQEKNQQRQQPDSTK